MPQVLDRLPNDENNKILCCYVNATSQIQIARVTNIPNWYFERVVFPGQRLVFEANPEAILEIHTGMMASAILSDTIPCLKLALQTVDSARTNANLGNLSVESQSVASDESQAQKTADRSLNIAV